MKISVPSFALFSLLTFTSADESAFRSLEQQSKSLQLQTLNATQNGCTPENVAVRREW